MRRSRSTGRSSRRTAKATSWSRHVMAHSAGLSGFDPPMEHDRPLRLGEVCDNLAAQAPWWEPGTAVGYHAITQGYLMGEVVRRVDGRTLGTFFREEIAGPLGADFHIGLDAAHDTASPSWCRRRSCSRRLRRRAWFRAARMTAGGPRARCDRARDAGVARRRDPGRERPRQRSLDGAASIRCWRAAARLAMSACCRRRRSRACSKCRSRATTSCSTCPMRFGMGYGLPAS